MGTEDNEDNEDNEVLKVKKPAGTEGKYNVPKRFPYIIWQLERLQEGEIPQRLRGTLVDRKMIVTKKGLWLLGNYGYCDEVSGVLADRFNTSIYTVLDCLEILNPKKRGEIKRFREWLSEEDDRCKEERELEEIKQKARDRGYVLRKP